MKTSTNKKLALLREALTQGIPSFVRMRGEPREYTVHSIGANWGHTATLTTPRGVLVIDPDDIGTVRLLRQPEKPQPEDESQFEMHVTD